MIEAITDVAYGPDPSHTLDVIRDDRFNIAPAVLYLHGGGWRSGDKAVDSQSRLWPVAQAGVIVISMNYRLLPSGAYPAPVVDAKRAVRWVRRHGPGYGIDVRRVGIWGASAGAYVAMTAALSNGTTEFEQDGADTEESRIDAVVDWFGPTDFTASLRRSPLEERLLGDPLEVDFLGGHPLDADDVRAAGVHARITADSPPFLIAHGDQDRITPISQSVTLHDALARAGASSTFITLGGAGHEGPEFDSRANLAMTAAFLRATLA